MTDILTVKRMLADRAQSVAEMLLPGGRKDGPEWRAGSTAGEKGQSLGVHLVGDKAGVWQDFATGEGGDLLDLWVVAKGGTLSQALDDARRWLGVERPEPYRKPEQAYTRPAKPDCRKPQEAVRDYLTEDRNIPPEVIDAYRVGEAGRWMVFPYLRDGELIMVKHECVDRDGAGKKQIRSSAESEDCLFGWQVVPDDARTVVITEGEKDAMSWLAYGHPALSVPRGGGKGAKQKWIENEYDRLERFERIYLSMDMDKAGDEGAAEIASRLGRHRCYRVNLPLKDANECLMAGRTRAEMDAALLAADNLDPEGLRRASEFADQVIRLFWPAQGEHVGYTVPYGKLADLLAFRPAEVTLWSGASGMGKSQILSDCVPHWIKQGSRVCLASFEMKCAQTLKRMCKQTGGLDRPTAQYIDRIIGWLDHGLLLYERVGKAGIDELLQIFDYARAKYGCDQFIIDSLMRLGIAQDDYNGQEKAMFRLVDWAIQHNVHVHLVAHARKGEKGQGAPETEDIKGAMEIGANAFNILTVWRNRKHEELIHAAKTEAEKEQLYSEKPGVLLNVAKQRNGDFEGKVSLWFDQKTYRYHPSPTRGLWDRQFLPREQEAA